MTMEQYLMKTLQKITTHKISAKKLHLIILFLLKNL